MSAISIDLRIADEAWGEEASLEALASTAIEAARAELSLTRGGEVAILLTDDAEMRALNSAWRGMDKPTDVLSFPADEADPGFIGDIALGLGTCLADAERLERPFAAHVSHLFIHGFLHLLGYDHETGPDAEEMEALEIKALASLGVPDPYENQN